MRNYGLLIVLMFTASLSLAAPANSAAVVAMPARHAETPFPQSRASFLDQLRADLKLQQALVACVEKAKDMLAGSACVQQLQAKRLSLVKQNPARQAIANDWWVPR